MERLFLEHQASGVSIILAVHNNASTLEELCERLRAAVIDRPLEIVMVNDHSDDHSLAEIRRLNVTEVDLQRREGQNNAILKGLTIARYPIVYVMDADLEDPPEAAPAMINALASDGVGVIFSSRFEDAPWTSRLFRHLMVRLFPTLPHNPCLCFAADQPSCRAIRAHAVPGDYLVAVIGALGLSARSYPVKRSVRPSGRSAYSGLRRIRYAATMLLSAIRIKRRLAVHNLPVEYK